MKPDKITNPSNENSSCFDDLYARGIIKKTSNDEAVQSLIDQGKAILYWGTDPTGVSAHTGHLMGLITLKRLQNFDNKVIILLGGATGLIGDPSGKSNERVLLSNDEVQVNQKLLLESISQVIDLSSDSDTEVVNNKDWFQRMNIPDFLRDVGKNFSLSTMLKLESVKSRLDSEVGISFTEFTYSLLQAFDFKYLYTKYGCNLQVGGSDQYGNIIAGIDYTRRSCGGKVYGLTTPLISTASGEKMGKSVQGGAIWLSPELTSPYDFYQYWINTADSDVEKMLLIYTFEPIDKIKQIVKEDIIAAKELLAFAVTSIVHSEEQAEQAKETSADLFSGQGGNAAGMPEIFISDKKLKQGVEFTTLMVDAGLAGSKSAVRRLIQQGGAYLNDSVIKDVVYKITENDLTDNSLILRSGKKKYCRVSISLTNQSEV